MPLETPKAPATDSELRQAKDALEEEKRISAQALADLAGLKAELEEERGLTKHGEARIEQLMQDLEEAREAKQGGGVSRRRQGATPCGRGPRCLAVEGEPELNRTSSLAQAEGLVEFFPVRQGRV